MDIISGLLKPNKGSFKIGNEYNSETFPQNWHNNIGYVPQNISLIDDTLVRNIALAIDDKEINYKRIDQVIKLSQLENFVNSSGTNSILGKEEYKFQVVKSKELVSQELYIMIDLFIYLMKQLMP